MLLGFGQRDQCLAFSIGFDRLPLFFRFGSYDLRLLLGLSGFDDRRFKLPLSAQDFLFLHSDLFLRADAVDPDLFGDHVLFCAGFRKGTGLTGAGLLGLHLGQVLRLLDLKVALRLSDLRFGIELHALALLQCDGRFHLGVPLRFGFSDFGVAFHFGCPPPAKRVEILLLIADFQDGQNIYADPHPFQVCRGFRGQLLSKALPIVVDLFDGQRPQYRSQMSFERLKDHLLDFIVAHREKPFGGRLEKCFFPADLHIRDGFHGNRHAFYRVCPLDHQRDGHHIQREILDFFKQRPAHCGAAFHHSVSGFRTVGQAPRSSAENGDFVRRDFDVVSTVEPSCDEHRQEQHHDDDGYGVLSNRRHTQVRQRV